MAVEVLIPKLGLTMEYGLIEEWLVDPGTPVKPGDPLLRLATDKVDVEVEAEGPACSTRRSSRARNSRPAP